MRNKRLSDTIADNRLPLWPLLVFVACIIGLGFVGATDCGRTYTTVEKKP